MDESGYVYLNKRFTDLVADALKACNARVTTGWICLAVRDNARAMTRESLRRRVLKSLDLLLDRGSVKIQPYKAGYLYRHEGTDDGADILEVRSGAPNKGVPTITQHSPQKML